MAKPATTKPLSKSEVLNAMGEAVGAEVSPKHVKQGRTGATREGDKGRAGVIGRSSGQSRYQARVHHRDPERAVTARRPLHGMTH
jgi:hypothetical protein